MASRSHIQNDKTGSHLPKMQGSTGRKTRASNLATMLQRAKLAPETLRPADVWTLQRTLGNQATGYLLQAKLKLGSTGERGEQDGDHAGLQVMGPLIAPSPPKVQREEIGATQGSSIQTSRYASSIADLQSRKSAYSARVFTVQKASQTGEEDDQLAPAESLAASRFHATGNLLLVPSPQHEVPKVQREEHDEGFEQVSLSQESIFRIQPGIRSDSRAVALRSISSSLPATIQRTVTQIMAGTDNKIGKLHIVGRPGRAFGNSMGDHTTAFATHVEAIKLRMEDKSLWEALVGLRTMYLEAKKLPGYSLKDKLPREEVVTFGRMRPHGNRLTDAETHLDTLSKNLPQNAEIATTVDQTEFALKLQECVNAYLEFRELIPLSAVNVMSVAPALAGKGKGESGYSAVLAQYEKGASVYNKEQLTTAILGVFDTDAAAMVVAATDDKALAALAPGLSTEVSAAKRVELLAEQHLKAIESGFPKSYAESGLTIEQLKSLIIAKARDEMLRNRQLFVTRYSTRLEKYNELDLGIKAKIYGSFEKKYRNSLGMEIEHIETQIKKLNEVLGDSTLPTPIVGIKAPTEKEETEQQIKETDEAQKREDETVEDETRKQPIATQIMLRNDGPFGYKINKIDIAGRPPSPISNSMGAHSTAWLVHVDRVSQALAGSTIDGALKIMNEELVGEAENLQITLAKADPPQVYGQAALAAKALEVLKARQKKRIDEYGSPSRLAFELQQYINELFTYINYIPGVTRVAVNTAGRGEGTHRKVLTEFEKFARGEQNKARASILKNKKAERSRKSVKDISKSKNEQTREKPKKLHVSKRQYNELRIAVDGLLDANGLSSKDIYSQAHMELIRKTYPHTWQAIKDHE